MTLHPLTPRKPEGLALACATFVGLITAVTAFCLVTTIAPPTAWLHASDEPIMADLVFLAAVFRDLFLAGIGDGLLALLASFPEKLTAALASLDIRETIVIRIGTAGMVGLCLSTMLRKLILSSAIARPAVQHVDGPQLLTGGAGIRSLGTEWRRRFGKEPAGIALADGLHMPRQLEAEHILLTGGTGAGKTTVLQTILDGALNQGDRILALDVKGDMTARWPSNDFSLLSIDDARSVSWDIGRDIRSPDDAMELAIELIPETSDPSWSSGARRVLAALVEVLQDRAEKSGRSWSWRHLNALLQKPIAELHQLLANEHPAEAAFIDVTNEANLKQAMSFYLVLVANAGRIVRTCANMGARRNSQKSGNSLSIREWVSGKGPVALLLHQSQRQPELSATMARLALKIVADAAVTAANQEQPVPIWLTLDELPQLGNCAAVPRLAAIGRSAGIRLVCAIQSPAQLRDIYGREAAQALMDNFTTKVVGRVSSGNTASEISSTWIGKRTVRWWENFGSTNTGKGRSEERTKDIPVVDTALLSQSLGLHTDPFGRSRVHALVLGHGNVVLLKWPVGRWPVLRPTLTDKNSRASSN